MYSRYYLANIIYQVSSANFVMYNKSFGHEVIPNLKTFNETDLVLEPMEFNLELLVHIYNLYSYLFFFNHE